MDAVRGWEISKGGACMVKLSAVPVVGSQCRDRLKLHFGREKDAKNIVDPPPSI